MGGVTLGTVIEKERYNHESVRFEYSVGGNRYVGTAGAGRGGLPPYDVIRVGDTIVVKYLPQNPLQSVGGDRPDVYETMSFFLFVLVPCVCLSLAIVAAVGLRYRRPLMWPDIIDRLVRRKSV